MIRPIDEMQWRVMSLMRYMYRDEDKYLLVFCERLRREHLNGNMLRYNVSGLPFLFFLTSLFLLSLYFIRIAHMYGRVQTSRLRWMSNA
jgi:hypothetical protein